MRQPKNPEKPEKIKGQGQKEIKKGRPARGKDLFFKSEPGKLSEGKPEAERESAGKVKPRAMNLPPWYLAGKSSKTPARLVNYFVTVQPS